jgi:hypothetical protein
MKLKPALRLLPTTLVIAFAMLTGCLPESYDNLLANVVVGDGTNIYPLTPPFSATTYVYSLGLVPGPTYSLTLTLSSPTATITSVQENGSPDSNVGTTYTLLLASFPDVVVIVVTSEKGAAMTYSITISAI